MNNRCPAFLVVTLLTVLAVPRCPAQQPAKSGTAPAGPSLDERLLFFPAKFPAGNWQPRDLRFQDVFFSAADGTKLHGWYCPCEKPRAVILLAHGNAGHVASRAGWLRHLQSQLKVSVFIFDYRGYGRSEGVPTVAGAISDATAARAKLRELASVEDDEILLMGESLGGAIAVQLAAAAPPRALILQSTFSSLRDMASAHYPQLAWLVPKDKLDSATQIARYRGPLLQSHGNRDRTVPFALGEKLHRAANEPKQFVTVRKADHNNWLTRAYLRQLDTFITRVAP